MHYSYILQISIVVIWTLGSGLSLNLRQFISPSSSSFYQNFEQISSGALFKTFVASNPPVIFIDQYEALREKLLSECDQYNEDLNFLWSNGGSGGVNKFHRNALLGSGSLLTNSSSIDGKNSVFSGKVKSILGLINSLSSMNPTSNPTLGWKSNFEDCPIDGIWKLRFSTAADATFKPGKRGPASTMQLVNSTAGTITNVIEFKENKGKVKAFKVLVDASVDSDDELKMNLSFKDITIERRARSWSPFKVIKLPFPDFSQILKLIRRNNQGKSKTPYFKIIYLDDEMRIHVTGDGQYYVQTRLYEAWDPSQPQGWTLVSAV